MVNSQKKQSRINVFGGKKKGPVAGSWVNKLNYYNFKGRDQMN